MSITVDASIKGDLSTLGRAIVALIGCDVVLGLENRVPFPVGDFAAMTVIAIDRQATNTVATAQRGVTTEIDSTIDTFNTLTVQVDFYGVNAHNNATTLEMLSRDGLMIEHGINPLGCSTPRNIPFTDGEEMQTQRWSIDFDLQFNNRYTLPVDSATALKADVYEATRI